MRSTRPDIEHKPAVPLSEVIDYCNRLLTPARFADYEGAVNGLQMENRGGVRKVIAAVDATLATVQQAVAAAGQLLIVHHGLFWNPAHPWTGKRYQLIRVLVEHELAVYSMHLPLDAHPRLGNAAQLASALGFTRLQPFFEERGQFLGWQAVTRLQRRELGRRLGLVLGGHIKLLAGGSEQCRRVGICTGGAGSHLRRTASEGVDTFITGEGPHWTHGIAEELGLNVFYGGHYATETFGVKALAAELSRKFRIPWEFVDHPSGL